MTMTEAPPSLECPHCGTPYATGQEYCLECGRRLPVEERLADPAVAAGADWRWPVLVAGVVAVLAAGAVVAARATQDDEEPFFIATTATPTSPPLTETAPTPDTTATTATTAPPPETQPPPPPPQPGRLIGWPANTDGYTVVLASLPEAAGRAAATRKAREASDAGLSQVGVLLSSRYQSLHPGYFVVFAGVHGTRAEAEQAVSAARQAGYDAAYARQISS
jgi:hypothetical protein